MGPDTRAVMEEVFTCRPEQSQFYNVKKYTITRYSPVLKFKSESMNLSAKYASVGS